MDMIEVDLRQCKTGEVVLFHDDDLAAITGHDGRLSETDWVTLRTLTIHDSEERIPTLNETIEVVPPTVGLNLELKETGLTSAVTSILDGTDHPVLVSSFFPEALEEVENDARTINTALLFEGDAVSNLDRALDLGCKSVHPHYELCLDTDIVERAHRAGLSVNAWTVSDAETTRALIERGVDSLILDRTGLV